MEKSGDGDGVGDRLGQEEGERGRGQIGRQRQRRRWRKFAGWEWREGTENKTKADFKECGRGRDGDS